MKRSSLLLLVTCATALLLPTAGRSQLGMTDPARRFGVGQKLRLFEEAYDEQTDAEARQRALTKLKPVTFLFLGGKLDEVARTFDQARFALRSQQEPALAVQWAEALWLKPAARFVELNATVPATLEAFYKVKAEMPEKVKLRVTLKPVQNGKGRVLFTGGIEKLPLETKLDLKGVPEGDHALLAEIVDGQKVLAHTEQRISVAAKLGERLEKLQKAVNALPSEPATTEKTTLREWTKLLIALHQKEAKETYYSAARILSEAETAAKTLADGGHWLGNKRPGQFWLTLAGEKGTTTVRLLAPEAVKQGKPLPLVIALHGAGGSENMFFDAYGRGAIVKPCEERGWLLVAPRSAGLAQGLRLAEVIEEVSRLYPVDKKRVFVVGHSMGAGQAVAAAVQMPQRFASVAALGGGGQVKPSDGLKAVPFFVGVGSEDFALGGAKQLNAALKRADVKKVEFKQYKGVEHMVVVHAALKDVFDFFDEAAKGKE